MGSGRQEEGLTRSPGYDEYHEDRLLDNFEPRA